VLESLAEAVDPLSPGHAPRVARLAEAVALRLSWDEPSLSRLRIGARLHDVGKLAVPAHVLTKAGPLDQHERLLIRTHPLRGSQLLVAMPAAHAAIPCVLFHHERWDGDGYPTGRYGAAIPVEARLVAIADAFDAMTSGRPYREPVTASSALAEIERCAGSQFDPELAGAFIEAHATLAVRNQAA
jgi:HD-GYP domain-containing protein (c-di-GMP phosphodiesterase class II)